MKRSSFDNPFENNEEEQLDIPTHSLEDREPFLENREPFNDAIDSFDIIQGYKGVKKLDQIPKRMRKWIRLYIIIALIIFVITICWSFLAFFKK